MHFVTGPIKMKMNLSGIRTSLVALIVTPSENHSLIQSKHSIEKACHQLTGKSDKNHDRFVQEIDISDPDIGNFCAFGQPPFQLSQVVHG